MGKFFALLYRFIKRFSIHALFALIVFIAVCAWYASQLNFSEDITRIFPDNQEVKNMNFVYHNSKLLDKVVFMISLADSTSPANPQALTTFSDLLTDSLTNLFVPDKITSITIGPDSKLITGLFDEVFHNLPLFLDSADYLKIDSVLTDSAIRKVLQKDYRTLVSPAGFATKKMIQKDPLSLTFIALNKLRKFQVSNNFELYNNHILTADKKHLLFFAIPAYPNETGANQKLFDNIDKLLTRLTAGNRQPAISVSYFGSAVVAAGNARQIKKDIIFTVSLAAIALILLIFLFFRNIKSFLLIMLPVLFGALVALAGLVLLGREVSAISLGIGSVLLGISVDFALHIYSHFRQYGNAENILKQLSTPIILSSLTTASAFLSLLFIHSKVLNDLGIFAAISVLSAALFTLIVLPHLFSVKANKQTSSPNKLLYWPASVDLSKKRFIVWSIVVVTIIFTLLSHRVIFKADMSDFNFMTNKTERAEWLLNRLTGTDGKPVFIVANGSDINRAIEENKKVVSGLSGLKMSGVLPYYKGSGILFKSAAQQRLSIERWNRFWKNRKEQVTKSLLINGKELHFKTSAFDDFTTLLNKNFHPIALNSLPILRSIFDDNLIETDSLSAIINVVHIPLEKLPALEKRFNNFPNIWVINRQAVTEQLVSILKDNLNKLVWFSILIIFLILIIAYGRIELTMITMTPMLLSWFWVTGIMAVTGISFNIFNIIIITFIFGLGIDYSIFLMRGMLLNYRFGNINLYSYRTSILLSVITTLLGIGVLIFAKHPALQSIALMSIIGIISVVLITFSIEPLLFRWMTTYSKGKRKRPITGLDLLFSVWSGILFIGGGAILSLISLALTIVPGNDKKKKIFFHKLLKHSTKALIWSNFLTPKKIINPHGEDFSKPAIIIANHQSHIDLMILLLQSHKVAVFTNRDNYNNKIYGRALKYAGFIPAYTGHKDALIKLRELISEGYSLAIFPEGHRSDNGMIRRFHKGAFYLAQELNLEIVPMIIHGPNELLKKSELFLKRGKITVKIYPRINLAGDKWGSDLREKKYNIQEWFRREYTALKDEAETPEYLSDFINKNYIYKEPIVEWYTKIKIKFEDNYEFFDKIIPNKATITDLGCGYGYLDFMLSLRSSQRTVTGFDYDKDKIDIAANCAIAGSNISFKHADISTFDFPASDIFILNDVLHYLPQDRQVNVVNRCIERLNNNGMIIIRDGNKELTKRHKGTKLTELFSTKTGFNKTKNRLEFISETMIKSLIDQTKFDFKVVDNTKYTSNIIILISKKHNVT